MIVSLQVMKLNGTGPTGHRHLLRPVPSVPAYSTAASPQRPVGVHILNECVVHGKHVVVDERQAAIYLHVDDTLCLTAPGCPFDSDDLMLLIVEFMETAGFLIPKDAAGRTFASSLHKVIGFQIDQSKCKFMLAHKKLFILQHALKAQARCHKVDVEVLRCIVGLFNFGAQLRREFFSILHATYGFLDVHANELAVLWPSVRNELNIAADLLPLMYLDASAPPAQVLFASDAMGSKEVAGDCGGYGVVATDINSGELHSLFTNSEHSGKTIARLHGEASGVKHPMNELTPTVPFSLLDYHLFVAHRWQPVRAGRWRTADHISLGEARGVIKVCESIAALPSAHGKLYFSLQDNQSCGGSMTKGRSPAWPLNYCCRKKASLTLASFCKLVLPWVQTSVMPADELSRSWWLCPSFSAGD